MVNRAGTDYLWIRLFFTGHLPPTWTGLKISTSMIVAFRSFFGGQIPSRITGPRSEQAYKFESPAHNWKPLRESRLRQFSVSEESLFTFLSNPSITHKSSIIEDILAQKWMSTAYRVAAFSWSIKIVLSVVFLIISITYSYQKGDWLYTKL